MTVWPLLLAQGCYKSQWSLAQVLATATEQMRGVERLDLLLLVLFISELSHKA